MSEIDFINSVRKEKLLKELAKETNKKYSSVNVPSTI